MALLIVIFFFGVLHGLGPDHLAAITVFGSRGGRQLHRLTFFSLRFALGHALVLAIAGLLATFGKSLMPSYMEARFDIAGGILLVGAGLFLIAGLLAGKFRLHTHSHQHLAGSHKHFHLHVRDAHKHNHSHGLMAVLLGVFFALGGFRALLTVTPIALAPALGQSALRIMAFTLGIIAAMVAYGVLTGVALEKLGSRRNVLWQQLSAYGVGVFSLIAGLLTLHEHLG